MVEAERETDIVDVNRTEQNANEAGVKKMNESATWTSDPRMTATGLEGKSEVVVDLEAGLEVTMQRRTIAVKKEVLRGLPLREIAGGVETKSVE